NGSRSRLGGNAVNRMMHFIARIEPDGQPMDGLREITVSLGTIQGGTKPNLVADICSADLDCRHPPGTTKADVEALLLAAAKASGERVSLERFHEVPPAAVSAAADHVRILRDLAGTEVVGVAYGTEMAYYASHNPRSLVFGPGETERIHVPDERVALSEVVRAAEILTAFGTKIRGSRNTVTRPQGRSRT